MESFLSKILRLTKELGEKTYCLYTENGIVHSLSYLDFRRWIFTFSHYIKYFKPPRDQKVILVGENTFKWPAAYFAAHLNGLTVVHGDINFSQQEFQNIETFTSPYLIICDQKYASFFQTPNKVILDETALKNSEEEEQYECWNRNTPMSVIFTSGTTSDPKAVMLSEENFLSNMYMFENIKNLFSSKDRLVAILPFHHVYPFTVTVLAPLYFGASVIYPPSLKGEDIFSSIKKHNGTILVLIPRVLELFHDKIFQKVNKQPLFKKGFFHILFTFCRLFSQSSFYIGKHLFASIHKNTPSLRFFACGGAKLDKKVNEDLKILGFKILEAYGLTETSPIATINSLSNPLPGSVGKPAPKVEVKIQKINEEIPDGEICIKGPNVMMGYYKRQDWTNMAITEGWFHSGDLGYLDSENHLFITGRKKEIIVLPNGKNIYPQELENHYLQSSKIKEICITFFENRLTAVILPNTSHFEKFKINHVYQELKYEIETLNQKLPSYQRMKKVEIYNQELPKTSLGKVKRYQIDEWLKGKNASPEKETETKQTKDPFLLYIKDFLKRKEPVSYDNNLETDLGMDSLSKIELFSLFEKKYAIEINDQKASKIVTIKDLSDIIPKGTIPEEIQNQDILAEKIQKSPSPPLEKKVPVKNSLILTTIRYFFHILCRLIITFFFKAKIVKGKNILSKLSPPFIIAPNHVSYLDGIIIYGLFPFSMVKNCFFVSLPQYFDRFPLSILKKAGRILVSGSVETSISALQYSFELLKLKKIMCIFPEGKRSLNGEVEDPKKGTGIVANLAKAPLLPVHIEGTLALLSRKNPGIHKTRIKVSILDPIEPSDDLEHLEKWKKTLKDLA